MSMNRFANRAILGLIVLALLLSIGCPGKIGDLVGLGRDFEGCFQGADAEGYPIILTLSSPPTAEGNASNDLSGSLSFVFEDLPFCTVLEGHAKSNEQAKFTGTGEIPITVTRTETGGSVTMTVEYPNMSNTSPLEKRGDPLEEFCPTVLACP